MQNVELSEDSYSDSDYSYSYSSDSNPGSDGVINDKPVEENNNPVDKELDDTAVGSSKIPLKGALKTNSKLKTGKGKGRSKPKARAIEFDGDQKKCDHCKKDFKDLQFHLSNSDTKCALKHKLEVYRRNWEKLKQTSLDELAEKDAKIEELKNKLLSKNDASEKNILGIPENLEKKLKVLLYEFVWPTRKIEKIYIERYRKLYTNENDAFDSFFKNMIETKKKIVPKTGKPYYKKMGLFIKNDFGQFGLVIKCNGELFLDTCGVLMALLKQFYFKPHGIFPEKNPEVKNPEVKNTKQNDKTPKSSKK